MLICLYVFKTSETFIIKFLFSFLSDKITQLKTKTQKKIIKIVKWINLSK